MLLKSYTLLYIEDDIDTREMISEILVDSVKKLYVAADGKEGLELYKKHKPDLVLSDIVMPHMNGLEMAKEIRQLNPTQHIALLTAFNDSNYLMESINLGIDKYVTKPIYDIEKFLETLTDMARMQEVKNMFEQQRYINTQEEKMDSISSILVNIAHQWRQPLSVISSNASILKLNFDMEDDYCNRDEIDIHLTKILQFTQLLNSTIENFTKLFSNYTYDYEEIDFEMLIEHTISYVREKLEESNIKIIKDIQVDKNIYVKRYLFEMSILNIIMNSIEVLQKNDFKNRYIKFSVNEQQGYFVLSIQDNGGGIDESVVDTIFEPYTTTKHKYIGVGISMYITYQVITKQLNGSIFIENVQIDEQDESKGLGAKVVVKLPISNS